MTLLPICFPNVDWLADGSIHMKLGHCPKCMRTSFLAAVMTTALSLASLLLQIPPPLDAVILVAAVGLVGLWLAHLFAFADRAVRGAMTKAVQPLSAPDDMRHWPRRRFLLLFAKAFAFAGFASMLPLGAAAQTCSCDQADCTCPASHPNCFINPSRGESFCCAYGDTGCSSSLLNWCCPNGTNCYGDNGACY